MDFFWPLVEYMFLNLTVRTLRLVPMHIVDIYLVLLVVSCYSTDPCLVVVGIIVTWVRQCINKDRGEEDLWQANMDVSNKGFNFLRKLLLKMFHEEGNACSLFIRPHGYMFW